MSRFFRDKSDLKSLKKIGFLTHQEGKNGLTDKMHLANQCIWIEMVSFILIFIGFLLSCQQRDNAFCFGDLKLKLKLKLKFFGSKVKLF